jgi:predicted nucleic acid-binding protein
MPYFVDTSALFKRYQPEKGTTLISQILEETDEPIFISSITIAIALNLKRNNITFVSSDRRLCKIADEEGLKTLTP